METNSLIKQIEQLRDLVSNSRQVQWYEDLLKVAKPVTVSPISEVLSEEQIQCIKDNIKLRKKECYRHATLFCLHIPNSVYVEGQFSCFGLPIDHAFNKVGDKYVDITAELVLGEDVSRLEYISWGEYNTDLVIKRITDQGYYGDIYRQLYEEKLNSVIAKIYKTNGEIVDIEPKNGKDFQLKELNDIVGGYIELVTLPNDEYMVVNEEGKVWGLPVNDNATEIFHRKTGRWDYIVGDCLICKTSQIR